MRFKILVIPALAVIVGCTHSGSQQLPPTVHSLTMNVTSPVPSGSKWFAFGEKLASGVTTCDATTSNNYKQLNAVGQASSTYIDTTAAGSTVCEFMQYQDSATPPATSQASNVVGPFAIPANPTAPVVNAQQANAADKPTVTGDASQFVVARLRKPNSPQGKPSVEASVQ